MQSVQMNQSSDITHSVKESEEILYLVYFYVCPFVAILFVEKCYISVAHFILVRCVFCILFIQSCALKLSLLYHFS